MLYIEGATGREFKTIILRDPADPGRRELCLPACR